MKINSPWLAAPIVILFLASACTGEPLPGSPAGPETTEATESESQPNPAEESTMMVEASSGGAIVLGEPMIVRLELSEELQDIVRRLGAEADLPFLRLTLKGLKTPQAQVSVRAFVNLPQAGVDTPLDDPHYLGDVGFYPTSSYGGGDPDLPETSFLLDVGSTLAALPPEERLLDGGAIDVTLFAMPLQKTAVALEAVEIPFEGVRLSAHSEDSAPGDG